MHQVILVLVILLFRSLNDSSVISAIFTIAGYTYGPLLGLYAFGLFNKIKVKDKYVPVVCFLSPVVCFILNEFSVILFGGYQFGFELLVLNGAITYLGLYLIKSNVKT